jgi:hypothetical protein
LSIFIWFIFLMFCRHDFKALFLWIILTKIYVLYISNSWILTVFPAILGLCFVLGSSMGFKPTCILWLVSFKVIFAVLVDFFVCLVFLPYFVLCWGKKLCQNPQVFSVEDLQIKLVTHACGSTQKNVTLQKRWRFLYIP